MLRHANFAGDRLIERLAGAPTITALPDLRADYAGRIDWYPRDDPRGATARAVYQIVVSELDAHLLTSVGSIPRLLRTCPGCIPPRGRKTATRSPTIPH